MPLAVGVLNALLAPILSISQEALDGDDKMKEIQPLTLTAMRAMILNDGSAGLEIRLDGMPLRFALQEGCALAGTTGGFTGWQGSFHTPPRLAFLGQRIVAADEEQGFLLFADCFGQLLLPYPSVQPPAVLQAAHTEDLPAFRDRFGSQAPPFTDISSCVQTEYYFALTRSSSHLIYTYAYA